MTVDHSDVHGTFQSLQQGRRHLNVQYTMKFPDVVDYNYALIFFRKISSRFLVDAKLCGTLKNPHTVCKSRGRSSRCCGLAFYLSHSCLD